MPDKGSLCWAKMPLTPHSFKISLPIFRCIQKIAKMGLLALKCLSVHVEQLISHRTDFCEI
jgi:hypothetical protein